MNFELAFQSCSGGFDILEYQHFANQIDELKNKTLNQYLNNYGDELFDMYINNYRILSNNQNFNKHFILGYPTFGQDEPRKDKVQYGNEIGDYISLLQIDSSCPIENNSDIMWGDCGIANFFIHPNDLKNSDFSKLVYYWDCS